jgi:threonylcarbamoyladenosine tRNA methylthiotransferase MtaB
VRQARQSIRKARRDNPNTRIIVTGCAAQTESATFGDMAEVDLVIGNHDKMLKKTYEDLPADFGTFGTEKVQVNDIMSITETAGHMIDGVEGKTRAFLQVQNGCDHRCTFCIIPYGRGNSRSVPMGEVVEQIKRLVGMGQKEVVLTGVDLTSYGGDLPGAPKLGRLVESILKYVPDLPRLRLSSIDSIEADAALMAAIAGEKRLLPHFHLSMQSGDNMILKRLKRRHSREHTLEWVNQVRALRPEAAFGADIIAGFPTETDDMFANTLDLVRQTQVAFLHVFPYSPRKGTPAERMPRLEKAIVKQRAAQLRALGDELYQRHIQAQTGRSTEILMERQGFGRADTYTPVRINGAYRAGEIVPVQILGYEGGELTAQARQEQMEAIA